MAIFRILSDTVRAIQAPFRAFSFFLRSNPLLRGYNTSRNLRGRLTQSFGGLRRQINRVIPERFRTANPKGEVDPDRELPEAEARRRGGRRRAQRGRRVRIARTIDFTQVHLVAGGRRQILHIGSTFGPSHTEWILNTGRKRTIRLQFAKVDESTFEAPLAVTLLSAPRDVSLMVDNKPAQPTAPFYNGSVLNVDGKSYTVELYAGGSLPAVTRVNAAWGTNVGPRRDVNQDAIGIYQHPRAYMFSIADGVGGGYAGDEVSEYAVKYLQSVFRKNIDYVNLSWYDIYQTAYRYINQEVRNWVQTTPHPAGTTLTSIFIRSWTAYVAHVGDSRLYLLRDGKLQQITTDHNDSVEVETRNRAGNPITVTRSILAQAIGRTDAITADVSTMPLQPGDRLLMLTDGVCNNIEDSEIEAVLKNNTIPTIPDALIETTNLRNNTDNASVIVMEVMQEAYERDIWVADPEDRIYVGGVRWHLRLSKPASLNTVYSVLTGTGCLIVAVALFALGTYWGVRTVQNTFFNEGAVSVNASPEAVATDDGPQITVIDGDAETLAETADRDGESVLERLFGGGAEPPAAPTETPTPRPTRTRTPPPTQTALPTFTPQPTVAPPVALPSVTPFVPLSPTSTLRPGR